MATEFELWRYPRKNLLYLTLLLTMLFLGTVSVEAASHYIRAGASGANNGSSWTDAWTNFPSGTTYIRGDEYYVADGSYPSSQYLFQTTASGSTTIKICKATVATVGSCSTAHGSDTNWLDTYGDGQAIFIGKLSITTAYWIIDGVSGAGSSATAGSNPATYGFYVNLTNTLIDSRGVDIGGFSNPGNNLQLKHIAVQCAGLVSPEVDQSGFSGYGNFVTMSYLYADNCVSSMWTQGNNVTIENSYLGRQWTGNTHGVQVTFRDNPVFRNNIVAHCNPQCIEPGGDCTTASSNGAYYNNVFNQAPGNANGVIKGVCNGGIINSVIYGNTVTNSQGPLLYQSNGSAGSGNTVVNNLFYNSVGCCEAASGGAIAHSYNAYFNSGTQSETGVQNGSGDPFVSLATENYHLKAATNAGLTLSAPFNTDLIGAARGADGVWDRGAFAFVGIGDTIPPMAPNNLRIQ